MTVSNGFDERVCLSIERMRPRQYFAPPHGRFARTSSGATVVLLLIAGACTRHAATSDSSSPVPSPASGTSASAIPGVTPSGPVAEAPTDWNGFASQGEACAVEGLRACGRGDSKLGLICGGASWQPAATCSEGQACSTASGPSRGTCLAIASDCEDRETGQVFCANGALRSCMDLVSFEDKSCGERGVCRADGDVARCGCAAGYRDIGGGCVDIDECAVGNGGCDAEAPCQNEPGGHTCGGCPMGHVGGKNGACMPALIGLAVSPGELMPAFNPAHTEYHVVVPLTAAAVVITATVPPDASVSIDDDQDIDTSEPWRSGALAVGDNEFQITVEQSEHGASSYRLIVTRGQGQEAYVKAHNSGADDNLGGSVALSEDTLVVGAPLEDGMGPGLEGDPSNNGTLNSGAVYVYVRDGSAWSQQAYLKASNPDANDLFGTVVAISGDTIVVGAPGEGSDAAGVDGDGTLNSAAGSGAAYVFVRDGDSWSQQAYLKASNPGAGDGFGTVLGISDDTVVVGSPREASSGTGVGAEDTGDASAASGAAYVFVRDDGVWSQQAFLKASTNVAGDAFGFAVSIDDDTLVVAAVGEDSGTSAADGDQSNNAVANSGAVYVFLREDGVWLQQAFLKSDAPAASELFGYSLGVSGRTIAVGVPGARVTPVVAEGEMAAPVVATGAVHVFTRSKGKWSKQAELLPSHDPAILASAANDAFGASVKVAGDTVLVGAWGDDSNAAGLNNDRTNTNAENSGAAYLFTRANKQWSEPTYIKASNTRANDQFGRHTALAKNALAIGAANESSGATGIQGNQGDTSAPGSGAVYVFR